MRATPGDDASEAGDAPSASWLAAEFSRCEIELSSPCMGRLRFCTHPPFTLAEGPATWYQRERTPDDERCRPKRSLSSSHTWAALPCRSTYAMIYLSASSVHPGLPFCVWAFSMSSSEGTSSSSSLCSAFPASPPSAAASSAAFFSCRCSLRLFFGIVDK